MFHPLSSFASRVRAVALVLFALAVLVLPALARAETPPDGTTTKAVNVNTATAMELTALPGIGQAKADAIVKYREEHGPYRSPEDLLQVRGIGEALLTRIRPHITTGGAKSNP
jgi:competence ComEA-like helix-hairpin-helix protein